MIHCNDCYLFLQINCLYCHFITVVRVLAQFCNRNFMNHTNFLEISLLSCLLLPLGSIDCIKFFEKVLSILLAMCLFVNHLEVLCCYQFSFLFFFPLHYKNRILSADFHVLTFNCYAMIDIKAMQGKKKNLQHTNSEKRMVPLICTTHFFFSCNRILSFFFAFFFLFSFSKKETGKRG